MREQKEREEKSKRKLNHASIIRAQKEIRLCIHVDERQDVASIVATSSARASDFVFCAAKNFGKDRRDREKKSRDNRDKIIATSKHVLFRLSIRRYVKSWLFELNKERNTFDINL